MTGDKFNEFKRLRDFIDSVNSVYDVVKRMLNNNYTILTESAEVGAMSVGSVTTMDISENFGDAGGEVKEDHTSGVLPSTTIGAMEMVNMGDFLSRPVPIYKVGWSVGSHLNIQLPVWDLFTSDPAVRSKIRNYAYLRGDLNVRIAISGTPFHYSHVLVSPQPFANLNSTIREYEAGVISHASLRPCFLNYLSQAKGSAVMDIRDNRPADFKIPFMSTKPVMRLFNDSTAVVAGSFQDAVDLCDLYIYSVNPLGATSTDATNLYVQVYAWMDNVHLGTSTGTQMTIVTQSAEFKTGPVERIASRVSSVATALSKVPILKPYATAASMISSGIGSLAAIFGWSKPIKDSDIGSLRPFPISNSATTIGNSLARRITLDPLQEIEVSATALGVEEDEMVISYLARRSTLLTTFTWAETDTPLVPIYTLRMHPNMCTVATAGSRTHIQPTSMAFAVQPFAYWRGDIHVRLDIVCSAFHRGKFGVFYEPNTKQFNLINNNLSLNKQYMKVIDIQETQSVEFVISWASYREWLKNMPSADAVTVASQLFTTTFIEGYLNGYIGVVPFTELQSQSAVDPVYVNVYVYSPDLMVNGLTSANLPGVRDGYLESAQLENSGSVLPLNLSSASPVGICDKYFGERPISFRALLKRYAPYQGVYNKDVSLLTNNGAVYFAYPIMPPIQRAYGAPTPTYAQESVNLLDYLRYAYIGYKGGIRYMIVSPSTTLAPRGELSPTIAGLRVPSSTNETADAYAFTYNDVYATNLNGQSVEFIKTNAGVEIDLPFYSNNLFAFSFNQTNDDTSGSSSMEKTWYRNFYHTVPGSGNTNISSILLGCTGEDFNLLRYQGAPYYNV